MRRVALAALLPLCVAGCPDMAPVKHVAHARPFPRTIAVLPLANAAVNMQGPILVRKLLEMYLMGAQYNYPEDKTVDTALRGIGITDGGQLGSVTPAKLGATLKVDGLLYGEIVRFKYTNLGFLSKREVEVHLKLVDAGTGEVIFEKARDEVHSKAALSVDAMKENLVVGLGTKLIETAMKSPLRPESETVCQGLIRDLNLVRKNW